ncbi:MAG: type II toxin-antitoxin system VapC family toxin [Acidimicrobiales bacterium]
MSLLLDTHVLLWWLADDRRLVAAARDAIADPSTAVYVSAASAWEIAVKRALGKLKAPPDLASAVAESGFDALAIAFDHAVAAGDLPRHHDDPFDRMLVAQAQAEHLTLATADHRIDPYDVPILAAGRP